MVKSLAAAPDKTQTEEMEARTDSTSQLAGTQREQLPLRLAPKDSMKTPEQFDTDGATANAHGDSAITLQTWGHTKIQQTNDRDGDQLLHKNVTGMQPPDSSLKKVELADSSTSLISEPKAATPAKAQNAPAMMKVTRQRSSENSLTSNTLALLPPYLSQYVAAVLISIIFCLRVVYGSTLGVRFFIWRGHFEHAVKIAERRHKRRPHDAKRCAALADIYSLLNRHDERANEVYRKALRFDPTANNRHKIVSLIVQYCKHEEEMDSEVWKIYGGALSA